MADQNENHDSPAGEDQFDDKPSYDDINTPVVIMIGAISTIVTFLTIAFVQGMYNHWYNAVIEEQQTSQIDTIRAELIDKQELQLNANDKGRIAIEEAMASTLEEYRN